LVTSGLVDGVNDLRALDALPRRLTEGEYLCRCGGKADRLWVIVSGAIAVRSDEKTLYLRKSNEVVGEQNILSAEGRRSYDLVANEIQVEVLTIHRDRIIDHPNVDLLWRNIAKIISLKLKIATGQVVSLMDQINSDARILHAYTNEYALSRRLGAGGRYLTDYRVDQAIIWFSDVVNFSRLALKLAPIRAADLVQEFFNAQVEVITKHGGYVDKFIGDGLMAFWILPSSRANARHEFCEEVLAAALEAARGVERVFVGSQALRLRIGLHVGEVLSGDFGASSRHQFTLIGSDVNKAARLEQVLAEDVLQGEPQLGPIRVSDDFYASLSNQSKKRFSHRATVHAKNLGKMTLYS